MQWPAAIENAIDGDHADSQRWPMFSSGTDRHERVGSCASLCCDRVHSGCNKKLCLLEQSQ